LKQVNSIGIVFKLVSGCFVVYNELEMTLSGRLELENIDCEYRRLSAGFRWWEPWAQAWCRAPCADRIYNI